ncbi:HEAT repeat domain-containing protein, partial [Mycobacterium palustre]|uniref:HEAT repeat domain-containing protein n=1 Tax=Mycobacterium palustre TaxID=153971 RepID=UPI0027E2C03B
ARRRPLRWKNSSRRPSAKVATCSACPTNAAADVAVPRLAEALGDAHLDVRKAAVLSLTRSAGDPAARDALGIALKDGDADVRAYARRALDG